MSPMTKTEGYLLARQELLRRTENETDLIANLANASAILNQYMENINWVGFYLFQEGNLVLGPFQGRAACVRIRPGTGVCGTAFQEDRTLVVPNVHCFPGHIACDDRSLSEIVVPLRWKGQPAAVLDIDSPLLSRFDLEDQEALESLAHLLEISCRWPQSRRPL